MATGVSGDRAEGFVSPGGAKQDEVYAYTVPSSLALNQWALTGDWRVGGQDAVLTQPDGGITYHFHARDLHLVLGPGESNKPVRFQVLIDGPRRVTATVQIPTRREMASSTGSGCTS